MTQGRLICQECKVKETTNRSKKAALAGLAIRPNGCRTSQADTTYFDTWSPNMAWVLGYIWADGCISGKRIHEGRPPTRLLFLCNSDDEELLTFIKAELKATSEVRRKPSPGWKGRPDSLRRDKFISVFRVSSKLLVNSLVRLGVEPRKTYTDPPFPKVPSEFLPHFVRGFFDGDGTVCGSVHRPNQCKIGFVATPQWIRGLQDAIADATGVPRLKINRGEHYSNGLSAMRWGRRDDCLKLYRFFYSSGGFCLRRKKDKMERLLRVGPYTGTPKVSKPSPRFRMLTAFGETLMMTEWARRLGIHPATLYYRITRMGWSVERAVSTPSMCPRRHCRELRQGLLFADDPD